VVTVLALAALAFSPGCGGGGGGADEVAAFDLTGAWGGRWAMGSLNGGISVTFVQTGDALAGTITIGGSPCMRTAPVTGAVSGDTVTIGTVSGGVNRYNYAATIRPDGRSLSGTWAGIGPCAGGQGGTFDLAKQ